MVGFNDGAANIQSHAHSIGFGAKKGLKHPLNNAIRHARTAVHYLNSEHGWTSPGF
jgi:hypothetical protein